MTADPSVPPTVLARREACPWRSFVDEWPDVGELNADVIWCAYPAAIGATFPVNLWVDMAGETVLNMDGEHIACTEADTIDHLKWMPAEVPDYPYPDEGIDGSCWVVDASCPAIAVADVRAALEYERDAWGWADTYEARRIAEDITDRLATALGLAAGATSEDPS